MKLDSLGKSEEESESAINCQHGRVVKMAKDFFDLIARYGVRFVDHDL